MDWENERYVRAYTRDTVSYLSMPWQGQVLLWPLLRKMDRAGVLDFGPEGHLKAVELILRMPADVVEIGINALLDSNTLILTRNHLVFPNFIEAQEANVSDRARAKEYRARRRDKSRLDVILQTEDVIDGPGAPTRAIRDPQDERHKTNGDVTKRTVVSDVVPSGSDPTERHKTNGDVTKRDIAKKSNGGGNSPRSSQNRSPASHNGTPPSQNERNRHSEPNQPNLTKILPGSSSSGLSGSARGEQPPNDDEQIPCPSDLWERITEDQKATLDTVMIPREAQRAATVGFVARYIGRPDVKRFQHQWVSSVITTIQGDWNKGRHRPNSDGGAPWRSKIPEPPPRGTPLAEQFDGPISRRLFGKQLAALKRAEDK